MAVNPRHVKLSAIANCPHLIFAAGHYRPDGTCRCDDPDHTVMAADGYTWNAQSHRWAAPPAGLCQCPPKK